MQAFNLIGYAAGIIGFIATVIAGYVVAKSSATRATITTQEELIDALIKSKNEQKEQIEKLIGSVGRLEGQVDILKDLPLKSISHDMAKIAASQERIMKILAANSLPA